MTDTDVISIEQELCRIPEVRAARIVEEKGRPVEVHVLATPEKAAKQLVRDIQSVAMATFGVDLDRRIISVVQLEDGIAPSVAGSDDRISDNHDAPRIVVDSVNAAKEGLDASVAVVLSNGSQSVTGTAKGSVATSATLRLVAQATLSALRELEPNATRVDIETASVVRFGDRAIAVVSAVLVVPPYEEIVSGSAIVRLAGEHDAMARAVLDATNRRLNQLD